MGEEQSTADWDNHSGLSTDTEVKFYYNSWRGKEFAFHVAPFMSPQDQRQFIGNDKILIYFVSDPFTPNFRGNVNCKKKKKIIHKKKLLAIGFVVNQIEKDKYKMGVFSRSRIEKFSPDLPKQFYTAKELKDLIFLNSKKFL